VNFNDSSNPVGPEYFTQDEQQYYGTGRLDYAATQKIRLFGSWLYQYSRQTGSHMPGPDATDPNMLNTSVLLPLTAYSHGIGWSAPNSTYNVGADITITPKIVSTTRFGYFFENYHDFGWPTTGVDYVWNTAVTPGQLDNALQPLPQSLVANAGTQTVPYKSSYTLFNANKHYQFDQDVAGFKTGWWGTHNIKVGYQLKHLVNVIDQSGNVPLVNMYIGQGATHGASTTFGGGNCDSLKAEWLAVP
jgi:hypothetical protein